VTLQLRDGGLERHQCPTTAWPLPTAQLLLLTEPPSSCVPRFEPGRHSWCINFPFWRYWRQTLSGPWGGGGLHRAMGASPRHSCLSHAGMGSLKPNQSFPARHPKGTQCVPRVSHSSGPGSGCCPVRRLLSGAEAAGAQLPTRLPGHQAREPVAACLTLKDFQEMKCCIQSPEGS